MNITTRFNVGEILQINKQRAIDTFERLLPNSLKDTEKNDRNYGDKSDEWIKNDLKETEKKARDKFYSSLDKRLNEKFIVVRFDIKYRWDYENVEVDTTLGEYLEKYKNKDLSFFYNHTEKTKLRKCLIPDENWVFLEFQDRIEQLLRREELYDVVGIHKEA